MSFFSKMGKTFIRSAVSQVGRDGGRVVSNRVYGDKHAIKIQKVGTESGDGGSFSGEGEQYISDIEGKHFENADALIENGFKISYSKLGIWSFIFSFIVAFIPFLGAIFFAIACLLLGATLGRSNYKTKINLPVYKKDGRYKSGEKMIGYETKKVTVTAPAKGLSKVINILEFSHYTILFIGSSYFTYFVIWGI